MFTLGKYDLIDEISFLVIVFRKEKRKPSGGYYVI